MRAGCPSEKLLSLVQKVKSFTEPPSQQEVVNSDFALKCPEVVQPANKKQLRNKRGQHALDCRKTSGWRGLTSRVVEDLRESIPTDLLYPWTKDDQACMIAGQRVQLVTTDNAAVFVNAGCACNDILKRMCERNLRDGACVYDVLLQAINAVTTEPRFYAHST